MVGIECDDVTFKNHFKKPHTSSFKKKNFFFLQILQLSNWGQSPGDFLEGCAIYFAGSAAIEIRVVLWMINDYK